MPPVVPKFQRIIDDVLRDIAAGNLRPGDKLPSGTELKKQYGVSMMVVRTALTILRDRGVVYSVSGLGVFIAEPSEGTTPKEE